MNTTAKLQLPMLVTLKTCLKRHQGASCPTNKNNWTVWEMILELKQQNIESHLHKQLQYLHLSPSTISTTYLVSQVTAYLQYFGLYSAYHVIKTLTNRNASSAVTKMHCDRNDFTKVREMMVPEARSFGRVTICTGGWSTWYDQQQWRTCDFSLLDTNNSLDVKIKLLSSK